MTKPAWQRPRPHWFPDEVGWVIGGSHAGLPTTTRRCATSGVRTWPSAGKRSRGLAGFTPASARSGSGPAPRTLISASASAPAHRTHIGSTSPPRRRPRCSTRPRHFCLLPAPLLCEGRRQHRPVRPPRGRTGPRGRARLPGPDVAAGGRARPSDREIHAGTSYQGRHGCCGGWSRGEYRSRRSKRFPPQSVTVCPRRY